MKINKRILLVEDEAVIADSVAYSLRSDRFEVEIASDGLQALAAFRAQQPELIILDLMLPKLNGLDLCRIIRKESNVPIIILSARDEEIDKILGLELGADDYIPKPFSIRELIARVRSVLRRAEAMPKQDEKTNFEVGGVFMDIVRRRVTVDEIPVHLPLKQFELLRVLMQNKDRVVGREDLYKAVWNTDTVSETGSLDVHIRWLREKVEADASHPRYIRTVRGIGYRIVVPGER